MPDAHPAILSAAVRIPPYELSAETVDRAYGRAPGKGSRRFAAYDDDPLTLAFDAAERCLREIDRASVKSLWMASTTWPRPAAPQAERVAAALDLPEGLEVATFGGSWRCGAAALRTAFAARQFPALIVAADRLTEPPGSDRETAVGDGAAAVLIGEGRGAAIIEDWTSRCDATDWDSADVRFLTVQASRLAAGLRGRPGARAAICAPDPRAARAAATTLGLPATDGATARIGFCGAAHPLITLVELIESLKPGERALWIAMGDGLEAAVVEGVAAWADLTFAAALERRRPVAEYGRWLASRTFWDRPDARAPFASEAIEQRDADFLMRLHGLRCGACGATHTIPAPACARCGGADRLSRVPLARTGVVFTFTREHLVPAPWPPVTMAVVDLDGGGRILVQAADAEPGEIDVGVRVRLALRRLHLGGGVPRYYWKAMPA